MHTYTEHIIRVGLGITFLWVGLLIFQNPEGWGHTLQPWALGLLPVSLKTAMLQTAVFDIVVGFFLLVEVFPLVFSSLAFLHLATVIATVGITGATARDIGLAAVALALVIYYWPTRRNNRA